MKIEQNRIDDLNLELTLAVTSEDYAESRKKKLNDYRKKAEIKGFRKGMVPMSLIEKMSPQRPTYRGYRRVQPPSKGGCEGR